MTHTSSSDVRFQVAADVARRMASRERNEASTAWEFAWKRRLFPQWADTLRLLPSILTVEYPSGGVERAQRWLSALATHDSAPEEDLGDQGLALALTSLRDLNEVQIWREAATHELERMIITSWIERICEAGTQQHECRLKRLYRLARAISTLDSPTILFAARSLQTRFSESLQQGLDLHHDLEGALESLLDSVPNEIVLTLLSQDDPDGGWGFMGLEHALFLRGAQAPCDGLIAIACSAEQTKQAVSVRYAV